MKTVIHQPPTRFEFATSDPLEAREFMDRWYGGRLDASVDRDGSWRMEVSQTHVAGVTSGYVRLPRRLTFEMDGTDQFVINTLFGGTAEFDRGDHVDRCGRGDVYVGTDPGTHCIVRTDEVFTHTLALPADIVADAARADPDGPAPEVTLSFRPAPGGAALWQRTTDHFILMLDDERAVRAPLVMGAAVRLLAATATTIFAPGSDAGPTAADRRDGHSETLRRAVAFIDANPHRDISLADIARAAHVSTRAVQIAFRRQLDTTPTAYLRRVRLDHARRELLMAAADDRVTVTEIALRWGFAKPSRFAAHYRAAFGEPPSRTLVR